LGGFDEEHLATVKALTNNLRINTSLQDIWCYIELVWTTTRCIYNNITCMKCILIIGYIYILHEKSVNDLLEFKTRVNNRLLENSEVY